MIFHAFLLLSILIVVESQTTPFNPTDVFLLNCGSNSDAVDETGRNWTVEQRKIMPSNSVNVTFTSNASFQDSGVPQVPYLKARIFRSAFTYNFPVSPGLKFLRLHFYPTRYGSDFDPVNSYFAVTVNGFTLLNNFSADLTVKSSKPESKFLIKEFIIPVNKTVNLTFTPSPNSLAFVNGIEILSMPDRFYSKGGFDDLITNVGSNVDFRIENSTAFETVHRLNVGGQMVGDSGMFRRWLSDDDFVLSENSGLKPSVPGITIKLCLLIL